MKTQMPTLQILKASDLDPGHLLDLVFGSLACAIFQRS
jgi:hypothetical protein